MVSSSFIYIHLYTPRRLNMAAPMTDALALCEAPSGARLGRCKASGMVCQLAGTWGNTPGNTEDKTASAALFGRRGNHFH